MCLPKTCGALHSSLDSDQVFWAKAIHFWKVFQIVVGYLCSKCMVVGKDNTFKNIRCIINSYL